ncbi:relaxase domain-containing protein [Phycicoccus jejuensis]|uniref:relaxase domain-containing protein n=1 Tax=Phycicoccus jejuensis TaxID=367299 RepID=UPI00384ACC68
MTLHKLAAGSGYTYLTQQVAAHDATERGQLGLVAYYEEKGESPGRWMGSGLAGLDLADGDVVTEEQMKLLFGQGWHPRSNEPDADARRWGALGRPFPTFGATTLRQEIATAFSAHNTSRGRPWNAPIATDRGSSPDPDRGHRSRIRPDAWPRPGRRRRANGLRRGRIKVGSDPGRRLRPDLQPGEVGVCTVGARRA